MAGTIAVDFDGVIHLYSNGWQDGSIYDEPVDGAFGALRLLMEKYAVCVFTTRQPGPVSKWLWEEGGFKTVIDPGPSMEFWNEQGKILVTNRKLPALAYIDDRALRFTSWSQALADLASYERRPDNAGQS
jgi:hypothetical protein